MTGYHSHACPQKHWLQSHGHANTPPTPTNITAAASIDRPIRTLLVRCFLSSFCDCQASPGPEQSAGTPCIVHGAEASARYPQVGHTSRAQKANVARLLHFLACTKMQRSAETAKTLLSKKWRTRGSCVESQSGSTLLLRSPHPLQRARFHGWMCAGWSPPCTAECCWGAAAWSPRSSSSRRPRSPALQAKTPNPFLHSGPYGFPSL